MFIQKLLFQLSKFVIKRNLMTKQERIISEIISLQDKNLEIIINKSDNAKNLLLQSIFDRQIQEYIHLNCSISIDIYDRYIYRLNSLIIHNPSQFDQYKNFLDKNRFISKNEFEKFSLFFVDFLKI